MAVGTKMCGRADCAVFGEQTDDRRCRVCGWVTIAYDPARVRIKTAASGQPAPAPMVRGDMPVCTANEIPGWEVLDYVGEVFGVIVRSRNVFAQLGAGMLSNFGGEVGPMTNLLRSTREDAIVRLVAEARRAGADAVIAMRFDVTTMGDSGNWTEVCAYVTAVRAQRRRDSAARTPVDPG